MGDMDLIMTEFFNNLGKGIVSLNFATSGLGVLVYILQAWALYTIAERREIKKPWLAWIPVVNVWILGSISDQYQYIVKRQVKNKRKVLLVLNIATAAILVFLVIFIIVGLLTGLLAMEPSANEEMLPIQWGVVRDMIGALLVVVLLALLMIVLGVIHTVYSYVAMYDVFRSCDPQNSTLYLVLSLVGNVVVSGAYCIFLMLCKDKDLGMPPRKPEPIPEIAEEKDS